MFNLPAVKDHLSWETTKFNGRFIQVSRVITILYHGRLFCQGSLFWLLDQFGRALHLRDRQSLKKAHVTAPVILTFQQNTLWKKKFTLKLGAACAFLFFHILCMHASRHHCVCIHLTLSHSPLMNSSQNTRQLACKRRTTRNWDVSSFVKTMHKQSDWSIVFKRRKWFFTQGQTDKNVCLPTENQSSIDRVENVLQWKGRSINELWQMH